MKTKYFSIFSLNKFNFGNRLVYQFILFESKYLFSILFFFFPKSNEMQDRYHTHAFNALSIKLFGWYNEHLFKSNIYFTRKRTKIFYFIPKNCFHAIGNSSYCLTLLLSGPWEKTWKEKINDEELLYNWNRKIINVEN